MQLNQVIRKRVSVRSYRADPVPAKVLDELLTLAAEAPSWSNKQCWRFIVVTDPAQRAAIGKATALAHMAKACEHAPCLVVVCADPKDSGVANDIGYYLFDCALAMAHLVLAACDHGLGTCIVTAFHEPTVRQILGVPADVRVPAFTPLGYPAQATPRSPRRSLAESVFRDRWGNAP
jgi:nitroreductase